MKIEYSLTCITTPLPAEGNSLWSHFWLISGLCKHLTDESMVPVVGLKSYPKQKINFIMSNRSTVNRECLVNELALALINMIGQSGDPLIYFGWQTESCAYLSWFPFDFCWLWRWVSALIQMELFGKNFVFEVRIFIEILKKGKRKI